MQFHVNVEVLETPGWNRLFFLFKSINIIMNVYVIFFFS